MGSEGQFVLLGPTGPRIPRAAWRLPGAMAGSSCADRDRRGGRAPHDRPGGRAPHDGRARPGADLARAGRAGPGRERDHLRISSISPAVATTSVAPAHKWNGVNEYPDVAFA